MLQDISNKVLQQQTKKKKIWHQKKKKTSLRILINSFQEVLNLEQIFQKKKKVVAGKIPLFVVGP